MEYVGVLKQGWYSLVNSQHYPMVHLARNHMSNAKHIVTQFLSQFPLITNLRIQLHEFMMFSPARIAVAVLLVAILAIWLVHKEAPHCRHSKVNVSTARPAGGILRTITPNKANVSVSTETRKNYDF